MERPALGGPSLWLEGDVVALVRLNDRFCDYPGPSRRLCAETTEDRRISQLYLMPVWLAARGADAPIDSLVNPSGSSLTVIMN